MMNATNAMELKKARNRYQKNHVKDLALALVRQNVKEALESAKKGASEYQLEIPTKKVLKWLDGDFNEFRNAYIEALKELGFHNVSAYRIMRGKEDNIFLAFEW